MTKSVEFVFDGSTLIIKVDPNKDGQAVMTINIDMSEIPDEVMSAMMKKSAE
jgi:hypothetical protein